MLSAVFRLCYVQSAVTTLVASLRACLAWLGRPYACLHIFEAGQNQNWCADLLGRMFVQAANEIPPYIYIYTHISLYISTPHGSGLSRTLLREIPGSGVYSSDFGSIFIDQTALGSRSCNGPQRAGSNTAIESFWRCIFAEIWPFLW